MPLARPLLEYASDVQDPSGEGVEHEIEKVQRRAARFAPDDYGRTSGVDEMLSNIGWDTLEIRRKVSRLCFLFKLYHGECKLDCNDIILEPCFKGRGDHRKKIRRIQSRLLPYHNSFFPRTIREWNMLPARMLEIESAQDFRKLLSDV